MVSWCDSLIGNIQTASTRSQRRDEILDTLENVSGVVIRAEEYRTLFEEDDILHALLFEQYLALLGMVEGMIASLCDRKLCGSNHIIPFSR